MSAILASLLFFIAAFICMEMTTRVKYWHISRHLIFASGFFIAIGLLMAAWWAWNL